MLKEADNPGTRSGLINQQKESGQFSVIENGYLVAPLLGKYPKTFFCDVRALMANVRLYELARVGMSDLFGNPLTADSYRKPNRRIITRI